MPDSDDILVTVAINNFNYGRYLREAIDSALDQDYPNVEVVVVDDGSTDHSRNIISGYGERVIAVFKENGGQGSAYNAAYQASRGKLISFVDADDFVSPNMASTVVREWAGLPRREREGVAIILHRLRVQHEDDGPFEGLPADGAVYPDRAIRGKTLHPPVDPDKALLHMRNGGMTVVREFAEKVFPVPEGFEIAADTYLYTLVPIVGSTLELPDVLGVYRIHGKNNSLVNPDGSFDRPSLNIVVGLYYALRERGHHPVIKYDAIREFHRNSEPLRHEFPLRTTGQRISHLIRNEGTVPIKAYRILREIAWSLLPGTSRRRAG